MSVSRRRQGWSWSVLGTAVLLLVLVSCSRIVELEGPTLKAVPIDPPEQSFVYDAEGGQLAVLRHQFREHVDYSGLPLHLVHAVVAAEDRRFFQHDGVDARAIARAVLANAAAGEVEQGGSTITQQLVKNLYMPEDPRTAATKLREALLAVEMERNRTKEEILEEYVNTVYFGDGAYGVQAAAETYWRTDAADLDLAQAALLAAFIRSPGSLDPHGDPAAARARRGEVLDRMAADGWIDPAQARDAARAPLRVLSPPPPPDTREPHWVRFVVRSVLDDPSFGGSEAERAQRLYGGGLRIHTTLDPDSQAAVRHHLLRTLPDEADPDAAVVVVEADTGRIRAAAGTRAYEDLQFDLATQARRQPGSTFKAFVLAAAVTSGSGPDTLVDGDQGVLATRNGPWPVRNYSRTSPGMITLEEATRVSVNGAFARLALELGVGRVAALARSMGVESPINHDPPIALGALEQGVTPLDMAGAYATLANLGTRVPVSPIDRIEDADGAVVWRPDRTPRPVVDPSAAYVTTRMLQTVVERGTGVAARLRGRAVAGKTGTTDDHADAWFVGYTPTIATAVWMGHAEERLPLRDVRGVGRVTGGSLPASLWRDIMAEVLAGTPPEDFRLPPEYYDVVGIDPESGLRDAPWCPGEPSPIPRAIVPREQCPSPSPRPNPTSTATTPAPTPTGSAAPSETATTSPSPEASPAPSPSPSPSPGSSPGPGDSPSPSPSPTATTDTTAGPTPRSGG